MNMKMPKRKIREEMNVIAINSSARKDGNTAILLNKVLEELNKEGIETELIQLAGQVIVVGQDGDLAACQRIVEGTQYMTAFKSIEDLACQAAEYAVKMAEEGKLPSDVTDTMNDGSYDIPAKVLEPVAVTRDNIDEVIIDGGFHRRDEVYLNTDYDTE